MNGGRARVAGGALAALLAAGGAACGGGQAGPLDGGVGGAGGKRITGSVSSAINRNVDILFVVDDSSSMRLSQDNLLRNFPVFLTRLQEPPGLPNLHIAVISPDMGAGDGSIASCNATGGKMGIFQYTPRGSCTASPLDAGATYIRDIGGIRNYQSSLADAFTCIAALDQSGCGFEQPFAAILRALGADGRPPPAENQGFLRPDATLAIIMLTNEDDCSEVPGAGLFETATNATVGSVLGPPSNFRCNEFGHLCRGAAGVARPGRLAPNNDVAAMVAYSDCTSNETGDKLQSVAATVNRLFELKADRTMISVISIQGPDTPYTVTWRNPATADTSCGAASCPWPAIAHSCTAADGSFADPGVRTAALASAFGSRGLVLPICSDSFGPSLDRAAMTINGFFGPPCLTGIAQDPDEVLWPDCTLTQHTATGTGTIVDTSLPACIDTGGVAPCWEPTVGRCASGWAFDVRPDPNLPSSATVSVSYDCAPCGPSGADCY
jgi:hypothetical protein